MKTKSKAKECFRYDLLETIPTENDKTLKTSKLPTTKQVLLCHLAHLKDCPSRAAANATAQKIAEVFAKARIPLLHLQKVAEEVLKVHDTLLKVGKIPKLRRECPKEKEKINNFKDYLNKTFKAWPRDCLDRIKIDEDRQFFQSMLTDRLATMAGVDEKLSKKEENKRKRKLDEEKRRDKALLGEPSTSSNQVTDSDSSERDRDTDSQDEDFGPKNVVTKKSHKKIKYVGTSVEIPSDILSKPSVVSAATRMNISPAQQAVLTEAIIKESGGDLSSVKTAYAVAARARKATSAQIAKDIKDKWLPPTSATLHWDGKQISTLTDKDKKEERLPILVGKSSNIKLLGVAKYHTGSDELTGDIISTKVYELLESWNCKDNIVSLCFDTCSANTGHLTAACVAIQDKLSKALIWSACRHHVGEVMLSCIFESLSIEVSKSPDVTIFHRFKNIWDKIEHSNFKVLDFTKFTNEQKLIFDELIADFKNIVTFSKDCEMREDYLEMLRLCQLFLGIYQEAPPAMTFRRPGAMHKARWMAKVIYAIKIILFQDQIEQLPKGTVGNHRQIDGLKEFVLFTTTVYSKWWFTSPRVCDAPWNDLVLYKRLVEYTHINSTISKAALSAFKRHLWYLTPECVIFALFSNEVPDGELTALGTALQKVKPREVLDKPTNRFGSGFGKPLFPVVDESTTLADLVTIDSWWAVQLLGLSMDFLNLDIKMWKDTDSYANSKEIVSGLNVVNDPAERAVKLTSDFVHTSHKEEHFQNVLQVVESDRKSRPNLRRKGNGRCSKTLF